MTLPADPRSRLRLDRTAWDRYVHAEAVEGESITQTVSAWRGLAGVGAGR